MAHRLVVHTACTMPVPSSGTSLQPAVHRVEPNASSDFPCTFTSHKPRSMRDLCTSPYPQRKTESSRIMEAETEVQRSTGTSLP